MFNEYVGLFYHVKWERISHEPYKVEWSPSEGIVIYDFTKEPFNFLESDGVDRGWFD